MRDTLLRVASALFLGCFSTTSYGLDCPGDEWAGEFNSSTGPACQFAVSVYPVYTAKKGKGLLELPTQAVVEAWKLVPGVGYVVDKAYKQEGRLTFAIDLGPPPGHKD